MRSEAHTSGLEDQRRMSVGPLVFVVRLVAIVRFHRRLVELDIQVRDLGGVTVDLPAMRVNDVP